MRKGKGGALVVGVTASPECSVGLRDVGEVVDGPRSGRGRGSGCPGLATTTSSCAAAGSLGTTVAAAAVAGLAWHVVLVLVVVLVVERARGRLRVGRAGALWHAPGGGMERSLGDKRGSRRSREIEKEEDCETSASPCQVARERGRSRETRARPWPASSPKSPRPPQWAHSPTP